MIELIPMSFWSELPTMDSAARSALFNVVAMKIIAMIRNRTLLRRSVDWAGPGLAVLNCALLIVSLPRSSFY